MHLNQENQYHYWNSWKCITKNGRQYWEFVLPEELREVIKCDEDWDKPEGKAFLEELSNAFAFDKKKNANSADRVFRFHKSKTNITQDLLTILPQDSLRVRAKNALFNGFSYYETLQESAGNWSGDYGGPLFLMPGLVIASYITQTPFDRPTQVLIKRNILNHQNDDGGWGLHIESDSTMFGSVMQYVTLRILGEDLSNPQLKKAQNWILNHGGAVNIPQWGKFYLSLLNVYDWKGNDALLPEMWKFPKWLPFHPGKYWCHNRMIFLPMSYCFGKRIKTPLNEFIIDLRKELYCTDYEAINWKKARRQACQKDVFFPETKWYKFLVHFLNGYEKIHFRKLRKKALSFVSNYIDQEDESSNYIDIGPVNQAINSICVWDRYGKDSLQFKNHVDRWKDYLWLAEDGIKMNGYNGSQLWDTALSGQALLECAMEVKFPKIAEKVYDFVASSQIKGNPKERETFFRDVTRGCWSFSTIEQAWSVTDCTAEGMKTILKYNDNQQITKNSAKSINELQPAVDWLLSMQNKDGGWASYERSRAPRWIEVLNPALLFEGIMTENSYTECSSASMQGLITFSKHSDYRKAEIEKAISNGVKFIQSKQEMDGSWRGNWGVCFTYGTWFGVEGLLAAGFEGFLSGSPSREIQRACDFLLSKQRQDGSWGEAFESCVKHRYIEHEKGQIVNTAWSVLALMAAEHPNRNAIEKGIEFILSRQETNGDFPQEGITGVFNGNCAISYTSYRNVFPLWAIGRYCKLYGNK